MAYNFPSDTIEGMIERKYEPTFRQLGLDPQECFRDCVEKAKGLPVTPPNYGDLLLQHAEQDEDIRQVLEKLRQNGVRDEDIRSWYNMHVLERECILHLQEIMRAASFMEETAKGVDPADAAINLYKRFPRFGDPDDPDWGGKVRPRLTDEDRPLPIQLFNVISDFHDSRRNDPAFAARLAQATSLNAVVREEMRSGRLYQATPPPAQVIPPPAQVIPSPRSQEWRNWPERLAEKERRFRKLRDGTPSGEDAFICWLCGYVWEEAGGDDAWKHACVTEALTQAGFRVDTTATDRMASGDRFGTVWLKGERGFVRRHEGRFTFIRPSRSTGCLSAVLIVVALLVSAS